MVNAAGDHVDNVPQSHDHYLEMVSVNLGHFLSAVEEGDFCAATKFLVALTVVTSYVPIVIIYMLMHSIDSTFLFILDLSDVIHDKVHSIWLGYW